MKLIRIGYRAINVEAITAVEYEPYAVHPGSKTVYKQCVISFSGGDDCQIFYEAEAEAVWKAIQFYEAVNLGFPMSDGQTVEMREAA